MSDLSPRYFWMPRFPGREQLAVGVVAAASGMFALAVVSSESLRKTNSARLASLAGVRAAAPEEVEDTSSLDAHLRDLVIGRWKGYFYGERVVENRPDGAATMRIEFDFLASRFYGSEMTIDLVWSVRSGILAYEMTSGQPEDKFKILVATQGSRASYYFEEAGRKIMRLVRTIDSEEKYTWTRVE